MKIPYKINHVEGCRCPESEGGYLVDKRCVPEIHRAGREVADTITKVILAIQEIKNDPRS